MESQKNIAQEMTIVAAGLRQGSVTISNSHLSRLIVTRVRSVKSQILQVFVPYLRVNNTFHHILLLILVLPEFAFFCYSVYIA